MEPVMHLCCDDCWTGEIDDAEPRAIRWATRDLAREMSPAWGKFHYTEGNGLFTACGVPVVLFEVDGSPQEKELGRVDCRRCLARMSRVPANDKLSRTATQHQQIWRNYEAASATQHQQIWRNYEAASA